MSPQSGRFGTLTLAVLKHLHGTPHHQLHTYYLVWHLNSLSGSMSRALPDQRIGFPETALMDAVFLEPAVVLRYFRVPGLCSLFICQCPSVPSACGWG